MSHQEVKAELAEDTEQIETECLEDLERKWRRGLIFVWGLGFSLMIMVCCTCPHKHPGTDGSKGRVQVSITSHLFPGA